MGYLHSVQNVFLWWPNDELLFWFSSFSSKLPWSHLACLIPHLHHTSAVAILSDFLFHPSVSFKMVFVCLKWEEWERIAVIRGWCSMLTSYSMSVSHKYLHIYPYWGFFNLELSKLWLVCSFPPPSPSSSFFLATCHLLLEL